MREEFERIFREHVSRKGANELLTWLSGTDFFKAPASTRFHGAHEGGLCEHSVNVYRRLSEGCAVKGYPAETLAVCGLLHDLCKVNFYKVSTRNVKNEETGKWEKVPFYQVEDQFPFGHGEKSVWLIERFLRLTTEEAAAIRWHMGGFDEAAKGGSFAASAAFEKWPLCVELHVADLRATYLDEEREDVK